MRVAWLLVVGVLVAASGIAACSGDDDSGSGGSTGSGTQPSCNDDPFACPAGQTCWVNGTAAEPYFECLGSGPGEIGEACMNYIGAPQCTDGLTCFSVPGYPNVCTPFCDPGDPAHACPDGASCLPIVLAGTEEKYFACEPDGGGGGGGGAGGSSGTTGGGGGAGGGTGGTGGS